MKSAWPFHHWIGALFIIIFLNALNHHSNHNHNHSNHRRRHGGLNFGLGLFQISSGAAAADIGGFKTWLYSGMVGMNLADDHQVAALSKLTAADGSGLHPIHGMQATAAASGGSGGGVGVGVVGVSPLSTNQMTSNSAAGLLPVKGSYANHHTLNSNPISHNSLRNSVPSFRSESHSLKAQASAICSQVPGLVAQQIRICEEHPHVMWAVSEGARKGIRECQQQFNHERWNCSAEQDKAVFGHTLERGSRETAFIYAITSAGVVHAITHACSAGNLTDCGCDRTRQGHGLGTGSPAGWKWGGCSDNVRYGMQFARQFVDAPERLARKKTRDIRAMMNLHNNHAGRLAIANQMVLKCRCHGVSGSCELKTCWRTLPSFVQVGHYLKQKYVNSVQISPKAKKRLRRRGKVKRKVPVRKEDLVHIHKSPDYCVEDPKKGILGTSGRKCNKSSSGPDSCSLLCCGRGYNTQVIRKVERCKCKFHWCCYVTCSVCENHEEIYTCK